MEQVKTTEQPIKKTETTLELYHRVHGKFYKMYKNIGMQIKIADEVIQELKVRPGNIIGQQTAAATIVIRGHRLVDSDKIPARDTAELLKSQTNQREQQTKVS